MEFKFTNEDHTLGSLLQSELLKHKDVTFGGYLVPHPLEKEIVVRIESMKDPRVVLKETIQDLIKKLDIMTDQVQKNL